MLEVPLGTLESVRSVEILDPQGKTVRFMNAGKGGMHWSGENNEGERIPAGVYIFRFNTNQQSILRRATVLP